MTPYYRSSIFVRWNNLKMKVNQAKQRLGPRIQAEASSVTQVPYLTRRRCAFLNMLLQSDFITDLKTFCVSKSCY